jgi:hypothetical protein
VSKFARAAGLVLLASFFSAAPAHAQTAPVATPGVVGVSSVAWTWTSTPGATGYRVLLTSTSVPGPETNISGDLPGSAAAFTQTGLSTNTVYGVMVEAFGPGFTVDSATSTVLTAAAQPTGTLLLGTLRNQVSLSWLTNGNENAPAGVAYVVNWSTGAGIGVLFSTAPSVAAGSATATINDLPGGMTVNFDVQALNSSGVPSGFDLIVSTVIAPIDNQAAISSGSFADGISSITWFWSASTGATGYQLFSNSGAPVSGILSATTLSFIQTGLLTNTSYTSYIQSFDAATSTNSTPFTRYTLADAPTGLTTLGLSTATAANDSETASLSWSGNTNPAGTNYNVLWYSNLTSTVTVSTASASAGTSSALVGNLFAGSTLFFNVRALNHDGIPTALTNTSSTSFAVANQVVPAGFAGVLTFVVPSSDGSGAGVVSVRITSGTFASQVTFTVSTPSISGGFPPVGGRVSDLPNPIHLTIAANDALGNPQQPGRPLLLTVTYSASNFATNQTTLDIARFDTVRGVWVPLATDKRGSTLSAVTDHLSSFAVLAVGAAPDLSSITVGPNPLRPLLNPGSIMTFRNLPAGCRVRIFSYVGEKLIDLVADGSGTVGWDGRNRVGGNVASGVYLALIEGAGTKKTMRVAIER